MTLEEEFKKAAKGAFQLVKKPSYKDLLALYAFFKQAKMGDVQGKKPGFLDGKGRKKFEAWEDLKGMSPEEAMKKYIVRIKDLQESESKE